ncbi:MAG: hypothetical protein NTV70_12890 [Acidobacteria bacterium]|nr:hypothetical protein [Acidobacteriota bacterium]
MNSFLIRCWLDGGRADIFIAQHVRSGESFRSNDWAQIGEWVRSENHKALEVVASAVQPDLEGPEADPEVLPAAEGDAQ